MILLVSGEGPGDIGSCTNGQLQCAGSDFKAGPMAGIIDKLAEPIINYSLLDTQAMEFVSEHEVSLHSKRSPKRYPTMPGKKHGLETAFFSKNARSLAQLAKKKMADNPGTPIGAVLFHDKDNEASFHQKWKSIEDGFKLEEFEYGVPMLPNPKSEAWLICALKANPYQNCAKLETSLPGTDGAPHSAKKILEDLLSRKGKTVSDLTDMITDGLINPSRISMHSFDCFKTRLEDVIRRMLSFPIR
jgi:hypothetical protein